MASRSEQTETLGELVREFLRAVNQYLSWHQLTGINAELARPREYDWYGATVVETPSESQLKKIVECDQNKHKFGAQLETVSRRLIPAIKAAGGDPAGVLRVVHRARGGGGGAVTVLQIWEAVKIELQGMVLQSENNSTPNQPKSKRKSTTTIDRDVELWEEFDRDYQEQSQVYFAKQKSMKPPAMRAALKRGEAESKRRLRQSGKRKSSAAT